MLISLRDITVADVPLWSEYKYDSPPGFQDSIGFDTSQFQPREQWMRDFAKEIRESGARLRWIMIVVDGQTVGAHLLNQIIDGQSAVFHAHIFKPEFRRKGVCTYTYPRACLHFMDRFGIPTMMFRTPVHNVGALRVKEKLGLRPIGEEILMKPHLRPGMRAMVYRATRDELARMIKK